jgi:hypothetical protein
MTKESQMTTQAKIIANRLNAQKSTGPRTPQGKALASQNSLKHGFSARQAVISSEDQAEFDLYREQFLEELSPQTPVESMLAERIVTLSWRLKRSLRIQTQTIDALNTPKKSDPLIEQLKKRFNFGESYDLPEDQSQDLTLGRMAIKDFSNDRVLERMLMYERRLEHSLYRTLIELQRLNLIKNLNNGSVTSLKQLSNYQKAV